MVRAGLAGQHQEAVLESLNNATKRNRDFDGGNLVSEYEQSLCVYPFCFPIVYYLDIRD